MNGNPRMKWLLGALLGVVALALWLRQGASAPPEPITDQAQHAGRQVEDEPAVRRLPGAGAASQAPAAPARMEDLEIEALDRVPPGYRLGRDPWRFVEPPPPEPPKPHVPTAEELRRQREAAEAAERARLEALERQRIEDAKPKPPEFTLVCIGTLGPKNKRIFILATQDGNQILNVEQGDVIGGKFIVARAGLESLEIKFVGFPDWPAKIVPVPVSR